MHQLMTKQESHVIISDPREYQSELFERAKHENIVAVLDTGMKQSQLMMSLTNDHIGTGKTLIAVLLLRYILDQELENRAAGKIPKLAFFLVDKVTLVHQQWAVLHCNLDHEIQNLYGAKGCDLWAKEIWLDYFKENMAFVCTAEILYKCLRHAYITMEDINLIIFDEAHHSKKNHSYARYVSSISALVTTNAIKEL